MGDPESKGIFTITPLAERQLSNSSDPPPSPRNGILKPASPLNGKINTNPNWKTITENGNSLQSEYIAKKQVRHSIVSVDSTIDLSGLNLSLSSRKRCQRRLSVYLHTHVVLIIVCSLAILDAVCVIGQLICDILIMKEKLDFFEHIDKELTQELLIHITTLNQSTHQKWNLHAILEVIKGQDSHTEDGPLPTPRPRFHELIWEATQPINITPGGQERAIKPQVPGHEVDHGILYELTHTFHLGSLAILSLLLLETLLKVFAMGKKLKHHKLEIFDAIVVIISWCLDVGLWEGIWAHPGSEAATILMALLFWRVIRIVNSFVLVIQEKEHVHLKIVKQRLRQSLKKSKEALEKASSYRHEVKAMAGLCRKLGASESEITACSPSGKAGRRGSVQSVLERAASLTFISTLSNMGSLPSLFDMGGSSSEDEGGNERNPHKDLERAASHNPTLRSTVSCSTLDSDSNNMILDVEDRDCCQNPVFDNENGSRRSKTSNNDTENDGSGNKSVVNRTFSNDSVPPDYAAVTTKDNNSTRL